MAPTKRRIYRRRCPHCRRLTPNEDVVREALDPNSYHPIGLVDIGFHCWVCGRDHGFVLPRSWRTTWVRPAVT